MRHQRATTRTSERRPGRMVGVAITLLLTAATTACLPSSPSADGWHREAAQSLEDVASELATARLVVRNEREDRLLGRSAVVMLVEAEEAAGTTSSTFSALQPPDELRERQGEVTETLALGTETLTEARIAVVAGDVAAYPETERSLAAARRQVLALADDERAG